MNLCIACNSQLVLFCFKNKSYSAASDGLGEMEGAQTGNQRQFVTTSLQRSGFITAQMGGTGRAGSSAADTHQRHACCCGRSSIVLKDALKDRI